MPYAYDLLEEKLAATRCGIDHAAVAPERSSDSFEEREAQYERALQGLACSERDSIVLS